MVTAVDGGPDMHIASGFHLPAPLQAGIVATCEESVLQTDGVYCYDMAAAAGIALSDFYTGILL
jgi:hypothetical protein